MNDEYNKLPEAEISDDALIAELKKRFDRTKQALYDVRMVTKKLEEVNRKLEDSEKVKSNFLSNIKNEINNPLTSILGLSQALMKYKGGDPMMVQALAHSIHTESFTLDFQLRNIFAAAELESGETALQVVLVEVGGVIANALDSFRHQVREKSITVRTGRMDGESGTSPEPLHFKTDAERLALVVSNLLSNAIEFNIQGGTVEILYGKVDEHLSISVRDTGIGVSPEKVNQLFDRFKQLETGTTKHFKGHGLGLSITKAMLDLMQGNVSVESAEGKGCTFTLTIPEVEMDVEADAFCVDGNEFFFDGDSVEAF